MSENENANITPPPGGNNPTPPPQTPPTTPEPPKLDPEIEKLKSELAELRKVKEEFDGRKKKEEEATKTAQELLSTREKELSDIKLALETERAKGEIIKKGISPDAIDDVWSLAKGDPSKVDEILKKYPVFKTGYTPPEGQHQGAPGGNPTPPPNNEYNPGTAWDKYPEPRRKY
jgi:hypothetical protein